MSDIKIINEAEVSWNDSILGKATNFLFGKLSDGYKKMRLRALAGDWAHEYYLAIQEVKKVDETNPDSIDGLNKDDYEDEYNPDEDINPDDITQEDNEKQQATQILTTVSDAILLLSKQSLNNDDYAKLMQLLTFYAKNRSVINTSKQLKELNNFSELDRRFSNFVNKRNVLKSYLNKIDENDIIELSALATSITDEYSNEINTTYNDYQELLRNRENDIREEEKRIAELKDKSEINRAKVQLKAAYDEINVLHKAISDYKKELQILKNKVDSLSDIKQNVEEEDDNKPIVLVDYTKDKDNDNAPTDNSKDKDNDNAPTDNSKDKDNDNAPTDNSRVNNTIAPRRTFRGRPAGNIKESILLSKEELISERFVLSKMITKWKTNLKKVTVTQEEKELITSKVNLKALAIIQNRAELIYSIDDKADRFNPNDKDKKLYNFWKSLLLNIDNEFQKFIDVDKINDSIKRTTIPNAEKASLKDEDMVYKNAEKAGIYDAIPNTKNVKRGQLIVIGFKRSSGTGYMLLQKLKGKNWYAMHNLLNAQVQTHSESLGKTVAAVLKKSNSILVYLDFYKPNSLYLFMYNKSNGLIYNKQRGYTFEELESKLDSLNLTKEDFYTLTYDDIKPDVNRRTISNVIIMGYITLENAGTIYSVDSNIIKNFETKNQKAINTAELQHNYLINYANQLPE